jgi:thymidylate synthase (FAD)
MRGNGQREELMQDVLRNAMSEAVKRYELLAKHMEDKLMVVGVKGTEARKRARQAARAVMPNMTETRIVVTGNVRAWRHFVTLRGTPAADTEIRGLAVEVLRQMQEVVGNMVQDLMIVSTPDGHGGELVTVRHRDDGLIAEAVR